MFAIPEQFSAASKANFEAQVALLTALYNKVFEGIEKVVDLNLNVVKASLEESNAAARQILAAKDLQEVFSLTAAQVQPNAEKALAYGRHLASIASLTQSEFTKAAEEQIAEANRKVVALIDEVTKNSPAGSETVVAFVKSTIGNANAGFEQLTKSTKQAVDVFEHTAVIQFTQATTKAAKPLKK